MCGLMATTATKETTTCGPQGIGIVRRIPAAIGLRTAGFIGMGSGCWSKGPGGKTSVDRRRIHKGGPDGSPLCVLGFSGGTVRDYCLSNTRICVNSFPAPLIPLMVTVIVLP